MMKKIGVMLLAACLLVSCAAAETVSLTGIVVCENPESVTASIGGAVDEVFVAVGQRVQKDQPVASLKTDKVYALEDGVVHFFGELGDSAENVAAAYGAVVYLEPTLVYSLSASTRSAYNKEENKIIHPGESVYLRCVADGKHAGTGRVTQVSGTSFTVEVLSGEFENGEQVSVYRSEDEAVESRIGRGNIARKAAVAYTGSGSIVAFGAQEGAEVKKGDVLFETLNGTFDGLKMTGTELRAPAEGVVAEVSAVPGSALSQGAAAATLYPDTERRMEVYATESQLDDLPVGREVTLEWLYAEGIGMTAKGQVESVSFLGQAQTAGDDAQENTYRVLISFEGNESVRYGMNALVTVE